MIGSVLLKRIFEHIHVHVLKSSYRHDVRYLYLQGVPTLLLYRVDTKKDVVFIFFHTGCLWHVRVCPAQPAY
jgi:hypothetical protein